MAGGGNLFIYALTDRNVQKIGSKKGFLSHLSSKLSKYTAGGRGLGTERERKVSVYFNFTLLYHTLVITPTPRLVRDRNQLQTFPFVGVTVRRVLTEGGS